MKKRVIIVHGWDGYPEEGWFPWLKRELEARGFVVSIPQLPDAGAPRISKWVPALATAVGTPDEQTYFVGHSMGCQAIARCLATLHADVKVGGAVFVAGYFKRLTNLEDDDEVRDVAREWMETPIELTRVRTHLLQSVAIFSDDDPYVPLDNQDDYRDKLGARVVVLPGRGHFSGGRDGCSELPEARDALLEIARRVYLTSSETP